MLKRIGRRQFLVGGSSVIALPALTSALPCEARAQAGTESCFLVFFSPGGRVEERWHPQGGETGFTLPESLEPLQPFQSELVVLSDLALESARDPRNHGHTHSRGMGTLLTGTYVPFGPYETCCADTTSGFAAGPSLDQVIARQIGQSSRFASLELAVRWPTDERDRGTVAPTNCINFSSPGTPVPCEANPFRAYARLFGDLLGSAAPGQAMDRLRRRRSVLDAVQREYAAVLPRLGTQDRAKLDAHLTQIREVEMRLASTAPGAACLPRSPGPVFDHARDAAVPQTGRLMMDLLVMALECGLTRVGTLQFSDAQAYNTFPWLGLEQNHHYYQHDSGSYLFEQLALISRWYMGELGYLLGRLGTTQADGSRLLDRTLVLSCSEISRADQHSQVNMPFLLAGRAGGLRGSRHLRYPDRAHNDLLLSIASSYGVPGSSFGLPEYSRAPLSGLFG